MTPRHWHILLVYAAFLLAATLVGGTRRLLKPGRNSGSLERKYPSYILMNLIFLAASWMSPAWHLLPLLLACLGGLAAAELVRALKEFPAEHPYRPGSAAPHGEITPRPGGSLLLVGACAALIVSADWFDQSLWLSAWLAVFLLLTVLLALMSAPADYGRGLLALFGCIVYLPVCLAAYVRVSQADASGFHAVFLYLVVAANDAMAQITGELIGSRPLALHINPAKTVEGALGGVLSAGLLGAAASGALGWTWLTGGALGVVLGFAGLAGDLTASAWKRALGLRDFGTLLGAHGGVLDRFDGLIFAAPVFFLLTTYL